MNIAENNRQYCYCCMHCYITETEDGDVLYGHCERDGEKISPEDLECCSCSEWYDNPDRDDIMRGI